MKPKRKGPEDEDIFSASHAACGHGAVADVGDLVDHKVKNRGLHCLTLAEVRSYGKRWAEWQLSANHFEHWLGLVAVEEPSTCDRLDGIDAGLGRAIKLPIDIVELQEYHCRLLVPCRPIHGDHEANAPSEQELATPVDMVCQGNRHTKGDGEHSREVPGVSVMISQPSDLRLLAANLRLQDCAAGFVSGNRPLQACTC